MSSTSLYRTARLHFPQYAPAGRGRDYYVKYDNPGYSGDQFKLKQKFDYEIPRYQNSHNLFHQSTPSKYYGNSAEKETYGLQKHGLYHDQKPLSSYQLTDFLRNNSKANYIPQNMKRNYFISSYENDYNLKNRSIEKKLMRRSYEPPINQNRNYMNDQIPTENCEPELPMMYKTCSNICPRCGGYTPMKVEEEKMTMNNFPNTVYRSESCMDRFVPKKKKNCYNNTLCEGISTRKKMIDMYKKLLNGRGNYIEPENDLRFIDCRGKYSRTLNFFNYKPKLNKNKIKKYKIVA